MGYGDVLLVRNLSTILLYLFILLAIYLILAFTNILTRHCPR